MIKLALIGERHSIISKKFLEACIESDLVKLDFFIDSTKASQLAKRGKKKKNVKDVLRFFYLRIRGVDERVDCLKLCERAGVNFVKPEGNNINTGLPASVTETIPDYILIAGCDQLLDKNLIQWPARCVVNFHYSLLPAYKGKYSFFWQCYNDEPILGYSFHKVDEGIDTGEIVLHDFIINDEKISTEAKRRMVISLAANSIDRLLFCLENDQRLLLNPGFSSFINYGKKYEDYLNGILPEKKTSYK